MKRLLFTLGLFTLAVTTMQAQKEIVNVYKWFSGRNTGAIKEGSDVKGYYFFYASDKVDKKNYEFTLDIADENANILKSVKFVDSKDVQLLETSFNGSDLILLFYNEDAKTLDYQIWGPDGKKKYNYMRELTKKEKRYLEYTYFANDDDENTYKGLYPIEGKGFIANMPSREDKDYTFQVDFFSTEKRKQWTWIPSMSGKKFIGDYLGCHNNVVYIEMLKFNSMMDGNPESFLIGINLETGKQVFEKSTEQSKYKFYPASMSVLDDGRAFIYGEYFDPNANIAKDKSRGFAFWGVDEKGTTGTEKYCSWDLDMGKYLSVTSKGKIEDFGYMFLHNMIQTSDGSIYAIGEGYKKTASALGILSQVATGGRGGLSTVKITVTDMLLIKFDKDFNVKGATIYEKNNNRVELQSGMEFVSGPLLGKLIKWNYGGFDYAYTQQNKDKTSFSVM
ncbi:MAG TPA: DUF6770 family protein, partial [Chitinophagaceae bacterium]|nr:DUF6770 family protein [Chitinophagaceae bacterium]